MLTNSTKFHSEVPEEIKGGEHIFLQEEMEGRRITNILQQLKKNKIPIHQWTPQTFSPKFEDKFCQYETDYPRMFFFALNSNGTIGKLVQWNKQGQFWSEPAVFRKTNPKKDLDRDNDIIAVYSRSKQTENGSCKYIKFLTKEMAAKAYVEYEGTLIPKQGQKFSRLTKATREEMKKLAPHLSASEIQTEMARRKMPVTYHQATYYLQNTRKSKKTLPPPPSTQKETGNKRKREASTLLDDQEVKRHKLKRVSVKLTDVMDTMKKRKKEKHAENV